jgi:acyl-coenzyme A thioesterase PaaI-like protein
VSDGPGRTRAATRLRELNEEFVARELSDADLDLIEERAAQLVGVVRRADVRRRVPEQALLDEFRVSLLSEGRSEQHLTGSVVSGLDSPVSLGAHFWREGDEIVMVATFTPPFEGAPGMGHGGVLAAVIDEAMGLVVAMHQVLAFTAQLDVSYRSPVPLNRPVTTRAWLARREGRKFTLAAVVRCDETVLSEASGLFISVDPDQFIENLATR